MAITAAQVKELRELTGISMMECKKALTETNGNIDEAVDVLRKRGLAKAAKNADRATSEGKVMIEVRNGKAYILALSCETDFVAINEDFGKIMTSMMNELEAAGSADAAADKLEAMRTEAVLKMGENLVIKTAEIVEGASFGAYIHSNNKQAALVVAKNDAKSEEELKQVAMHTIASAPKYLSTADIAEEVIAKEREIYLEQMKNDPKMEGKPEQVLEKIMEGKINKFKEEVSLLTQNFVINPDIKVKDFIGEDTVESFKVYSV